MGIWRAEVAFRVPPSPGRQTRGAEQRGHHGAECRAQSRVSGWKRSQDEQEGARASISLGVGGPQPPALSVPSVTPEPGDGNDKGTL